MPYIKIFLSIPLLFIGVLLMIATFSSPFDLFNVILTLIFLVPGYLLLSKGRKELKVRKADVGTATQEQAVTIDKVETKPIVTKPRTEITPKVLPQTYNGSPLAYDYTDVNVCIIRDNKPDYKELKPYMPISFIPEPSNPYDPKAVIVKTDGTYIGYLYKGRMQDMVLDFLRRNDPIQSFISDVNESTDTVQFTIGFYKEKESTYDKLIRQGTPHKTFKLTSNRNEDMQDTLSLCSEGEEVDYEYNYEKEKYIAICGDEIGFFPKSANKYLEDEHPVFIEGIEEDEDFKYIVRVVVFTEL